MMQLKQLTYTAVVCVLISVAIPACVVAQNQMEPGTEFRDCVTCPLMVVVPPGSFTMGSPAWEDIRLDDEGPQHQVTISYPLAVGKYEVMFREWDECVSAGGCTHHADDYFGARGNRPVISVRWEDAKEYVNWLSGKTGEQYRLLSESEWEYVARAGTTGPFHFGSMISTNQANYDGNYTYGEGSPGIRRGATVPVGSFPSNEFGLHDVHGNVAELVEDCYHDNYQGAPVDGSAWNWGGNCSLRVVRGGSWFDVPWNVRSAFRNIVETGILNIRNGIRVARTLTP